MSSIRQTPEEQLSKLSLEFALFEAKFLDRRERKARRKACISLGFRRGLSLTQVVP